MILERISQAGVVVIAGVAPLKGVDKIVIAADGIVRPGGSSLFRLRVLDAEHTVLQLRGAMDASLRNAEVDALPVEEETSLDCQSGNRFGELAIELRKVDERSLPDRMVTVDHVRPFPWLVDHCIRVRLFESRFPCTLRRESDAPGRLGSDGS